MHDRTTGRALSAKPEGSTRAVTRCDARDRWYLVSVRSRCEGIGSARRHL